MAVKRAQQRPPGITQRFASGSVIEAAVTATSSGATVDFSSDFVHSDSGTPTAVDISSTIIPMLTIQNTSTSLPMTVELDQTGKAFVLLAGQARDLPNYDSACEITVTESTDAGDALYLSAIGLEVS